MPVSKELAIPTPPATEGGWTPAQIELIKSMCVPAEATEDEFKVLLYTAEKYRLDPLVKQIYMQKYRKGQGWAPATIIITYAGMQEIANREDMLDGIKPEPFFDDKGNLLGARSILWKKGHQHPFETVVYFDEYVQKNYDGKPSNLWATKPITMICKVANAQNLRQAFSLGQMYIEEEMPPVEVQPNPTRFNEMKFEKVIPAPPSEVQVEPELEASVAERIERAQKIFELTGIRTVFDTRGTWLEISEQVCAEGLHKLVGAATIQQAAAMLGVGKFGTVVKANFPDAQPPRMTGGPSQQYSALLHFVHDHVERTDRHKAEQQAARDKMHSDVFGPTV